MKIPREQAVARLREAGFSYKRRADRVEIYRQRGTGKIVNVSLRDLFDETYTRTVLHQAGLTPAQIEDFLLAAVKE
jgi:hypothetical protein